MLTPRDIHQAEFKRVWKGYSPDEVDDFLRRVVLEYERVFKENKELKERLEVLDARLEEYSATEVKMSQTLDMARSAARDAKSAAEKEAAAILSEARARAAETVNEAVMESARQRRLLENYLEDVKRYRTRVLEASQQLSAHLEEFVEPSPAPSVMHARREAAPTDDKDRSEA